jgi:MYXO-CTERM domain-containing protein
MSKKVLYLYCTLLVTGMLLGISTGHASGLNNHAGSKVTNIAQNGDDVANVGNDDDDMDWGWIGLLGLAGLLGLRRRDNNQGNNR